MSTIEPQWGLLMCNLCRANPAEAMLDTEPLCIGCADLTIDRMFAASMQQSIATAAGALYELVGRSPRPFKYRQGKSVWNRDDAA